jgi:outer membrane lipoprotein-sorting protein
MRSIYCIFLIIILSYTNIYSEEIIKAGNDILREVDRNLMPVSYESYRKLINIEPNGKKKEYTFFTIKKGDDKIAMLYLAPSIDKGKATLRLGDNMWLYLPNVARPVRITSMQSIVGGVFNNSDIMLLDYHLEYNVIKMQEIGDEYILDLKAKTKSVAYDKLKMWVRIEGVLLKKVECYSASGKLLKTLDFKKIKKLGPGITRPSIIETYSPLYKGYKSIMVFIRVKKKEFPNEVFTLNYLPRLKDIR